MHTELRYIIGPQVYYNSSIQRQVLFTITMLTSKYRRWYIEASKEPVVESTVPNLREDPTVEDGEEGENPRLHTEIRYRTDITHRRFYYSCNRTVIIIMLLTYIEKYVMKPYHCNKQRVVHLWMLEIKLEPYKCSLCDRGFIEIL